MNKKLLPITFSILFIVSCGGGGGGGSSPTPPTTPAPTVNLSAEPASVLLETTSTLSWSSSNASSCSASWTTQTSTSGSEAVTITAAGNNSFSITCTGDGGSKSASVTIEGYRETDGVVVDGYISGAEVCIDEDENWTCDSNENSTTSDNEGKFTIRYANGNLVSIGGTDLDSQTLLDNLLITHKLTGHSDFKAVTPVTSVAAFMEDASLVNAALGIDASIDVFTFDPVANKGDGGINDYLYEKGNQLTVLAFALQNITNNLNTTTETTQDYFKAITEEIEKEYTETETKVDIETEAFITKALENVITAKSVTIDETAKANTVKALAGVMPIIEVKSSDDLTTGVIRFAVSTLQTDIQAIANGTATAETVTSYTSDVLAYIAEDQNIDADEITPNINAIADSATTSEDTAVTINVVANDSYITNAPVAVTATNGTNGTTTIAESSPEQITYEPDADYNGTDTFSYTITQGDKTSSADVTIAIEAVNDAPSIDIASTIQVEENQTAVTTVAVSDVDEDELTLTLGGTDADSFNLSDENVLTFKEAPDYETKTSYSITLTLTDGTETVTRDVTIAITNVNDVAPEFTSEATFSAAENQTAIGTVTATDAEGDEVTFSISGDELAITAAGVLTFVSAPDYETKDAYTATVTASDGTNSTTQSITVNVTDVNEAPAFTSNATFSAAENQTAIGTVAASDVDGDTITYSISGSDITINSSSGVIAFASAPDYETKSSYTATVTASDGTNLSTQAITVNVINVNDVAPEFTSEATFSAAENQTAIGTVTANDAEGDDVTFTVSGTELAITSAGVLTFASAPDYETKTSYSTTVTASDGTNSTTQSITINITDVNEAPAFTSSATFSAAENQTTIGSVSVTDPENATLSYSLSGTDASSLAISTAGVLTFGSAPDYESKNSYSATVAASDGTNSTTQDLTINVIDQNDAPTIYNFFPSNFYLYENGGAKADTVIGTGCGTLNNFVTCGAGTIIIDGDPRNTVADQDNDSLSYSITGTDAQYINVSQNGFSEGGGAISLKDNADYETKNVYRFTFNVSDGEYTTSKNTQINILDVDEKPVLISSTNISIDENTETVLKIEARDPEGKSISYRLGASNQGNSTRFNITSDGVLTLKEYAQDYEAYPSSEAYVYIEDDGNSRSPTQFNVSLNNLNDNSPSFTSSATFSAAENQTAIGTVTATDADGDDINYAISGSELTITSSGILTFASAPDYESKSSYTATITASDGTNSTTQDITVNVTNINDNSPVFTSINAYSAAENQTAIGTVTATDADGDDINYAISGSELTITSSGILTFASAPDYESKSSYTATITASDGTNSTTQDITVNVIDVNEPPQLSEFQIIPSSIDINLADSIKFSIRVKDEQGVDQSVLGYPQLHHVSTGTAHNTPRGAYQIWSLVSGTATDGIYESTLILDKSKIRGSFLFGSWSGDSSLFKDTTDLWSKGISIQSKTALVEITDSNSAPVFTSSATFSAAENQTAIGTVVASDADGDGITFSISGSDITINSSSGVITFVSAPDYETKTSYSAKVTIDDGAYSVTQDITVNVTDVNEAPAFTSNATFSAAENQTAIGTVAASDVDGDTITYSVSGTDSGSVSINSSSGVLTFNSAPNYESKTSYSIVVTASDGTNSTTQNVTINITNVNEAPAFTSSASFSAAENQTTIGSVSVTDPENATLSYSLSGTDASSLAISSSGVLSFGSAPNYESKNSYSATVAASDGTNSTTQDVTISVTDVNDAPVATAAAYTMNLLPQSQTSRSLTLAGTDEDGDALTYSIVSNGSYGTASLSGTTVTYQTDASTQSAQTESFTFKVNDGTVDSSTATISISLKTDPLYQYQWHLNNTGQTNFASNAGTSGADLNVDTVISEGYTGNGVTVAVVDSGLEIAHEDLVDNIISGSYDFLNSDTDPTNAANDGDHGTSVAGIIAAKGWNNIGGRGVAPNASLIGYNLLKAGTTENQAKSWGSNPPSSVDVDIYNLSYGTDYATGETTYNLPNFLGRDGSTTTEDALVNGTTNLRSGKGAIYIQSAGNGYASNPNGDCSGTFTCTEIIADNLSTVPYIIQVGSLDATGFVSSYTTPGAALWISGFGGEYGNNSSYTSEGNPAIMTTDQSGCTNGYVGINGRTQRNQFDNNSGGYSENSSCNYTSTFNGTSSAAPTVAGVVALMLEANPALTWRDVKHILATTADQVGSDSDYSYTYTGIPQYEWEENAAGYKHHIWFGFGKIDAAEAVNTAKTYTADSRGAFAETTWIQNSLNQVINYGVNSTSTLAVTKPVGSNDFVEFVRVTVQFDHSVPRSVGLRLQSPQGTIVNIMQPFTNIGTNPSTTVFDIGVSAFYGENIEGNWTIAANDYVNDSQSGTLLRYGIQIYGN